jgi:hypothetical protein
MVTEVAAPGTRPPSTPRRLRWLALAGLTSIAAGPATTSAPSPIRFADRTKAAGVSFVTTYGEPGRSSYILETTGAGAAFLDFDGDGRLDLYLVNGRALRQAGDPPRSALYRNEGDGRFSDVTARAGVGRAGWGQGVAVGDVDNDGAVDLYLTFFGENVLFRNNGDGTFSDVTAKAGVAAGGWSTSAAFADYDLDGDLDLYVARYVDFDLERAPLPGSRPNCRYAGLPVMCGPRGLAGQRDVLYRNNGGLSFSDVTSAAGELDREAYRGLGAVWGDYDDDGRPDLLVANDAHPNLLFHNEGNGTFVEVAFEAGVAYDEDGRERAGMGVDLGDYDNDGRLDATITNFQGEPHALYRNLGRGLFQETTWPSGVGSATLAYLGWGTRFVDLDNDGWNDLVFVNGHVYPEVDRHGLEESFAQRTLVLRNGADGRFADVSEAAGPALATRRAGRGAAFGDFDDDGRVDVLITGMNEPPALLRNESAPAGHWLSVTLRGRRSNRDGIGARVTLEAGGQRQVREVHADGSYLSQSDRRAHFGLGRALGAASVEVRWPSGTVDRLSNVGADRRVWIEEGRGLVRSEP